jgi:hypothetical protein
VTHPGLKAAFYRWLDRNPDGRWVLRLDAARFVYLDVEAEPFVVRSLRWEGSRPIALLSDGSEEPLDCASLRLREEGGAVATVKGRFPARLASPAWNALAPHLFEDGTGGTLLDAAGGPYRLEAVSGPRPPA